jgi:catechol 2,3-dioxygenase-like lactoylglutathione lyase family enzyme
MNLVDLNAATVIDRNAAVHSIDHLVISVPILAEAEHFYRSFGLDVRRNGDRLDLYCFGHPHCWVSLYEAGRRKKLEYIRYGAHEQGVQAIRERVAAAGWGAQPHPLGDKSGIWLSDPDGTRLQIAAAPKVSPSAKCTPGVAQAGLSGRGAPSRSQVQTVRPLYLSHALFFTSDVPRMVRFSLQVLGLRLSDHAGEGIAFMHGASGSDHHLVAFAKSTAPGLHHSSWSVPSLDDVGQGSEQMRSAGYAEGWGVGRHVLGSNYFYYARDPWGSYAEYSYDIDFIPGDFEWQAKDHPPEDSFYVWGPPVPADFIINHESAARKSLKRSTEPAMS